MTCRERLEAYLQANQVHFEVQQHPIAFTAQSVAESEHLPGDMMVKVVIVVADGEMMMLALPTSRRVDLAVLSEILGAHEVRLADEPEFAAAFPDCEVGAMPPFGNLFGLPVYVDEALTEDEIIFFQAGTHTETMSMRYADFDRLVRPMVAEFALHRSAMVAPEW